MRSTSTLRWLLVVVAACCILVPARAADVAAEGCVPSVQVQTATLRQDGRQVSAIRVTLRPGTASRADNALVTLRVTRAENATVEVQGTRPAVPVVLQLQSSGGSFSFDVIRLTAGRPFQTFFVVQDRCGEFSSFAGAGVGRAAEEAPGTGAPTVTATLASQVPTGTPTPSVTSTPTPSTTPTASPTVLSQPPSATGFVTRDGLAFFLDGRPFRFVGANMYNAAGDPSIYECGPWMSNPEVELDAWFTRARADFGARVIRFWAFQRYTNGGTDWRGLDRVMRLANRHDLKVIPVLENNWADCTFGDRKYDTWYAGGYLQPYGQYPLSYREYTRRIVERYRNEPAVFGWMLMNEAEGQTAGGADASEALYTFTRDMSAYVKQLDPNHLVTLGTIGGSQPGVHGTNFERLHGLSTIDFVDYHDYGHNDVALPGAPVVVQSPIQTAIYRQDGTWAWGQAEYQPNRARTWETLSWTIPAGAQPTQRIGLIVHGSYRGAAYLDEIRIGDRLFDFEDGTTQGWQSQSTTVTLATSIEQHDAGARSLRVTFDQPDGQALIWVPASASDGPGTVVSVRVYVDAPGTPTPYNTLAAAMYKARTWLNKPLMIGEAGMTACGSWDGSQAETAASRAAKLDAKMAAFFGNGGAGYLVWAWEPDNSCNYAFGPGDPLNGVLHRFASALLP